MRKLIKKILKEDEYDFIRNVKPTINKGTYLCDRYGTKWINMSETEFNGSELVASDTDYTVNNKFIWLIRTHDYGKQIVRRTPSPWKIEAVLQQLSDGSLTICDTPSSLKESDDMQWIRDVEPYVSFDNAEFNTKYGIIIEDEDVFYSSIEDCREDIDIDSIDYVKVSNRARLRFWEVYCSIEPGVVEWQGYKKCLQIEFYDKHNWQVLSHWFAPNELINLHII